MKGIKFMATLLWIIVHSSIVILSYKISALFGKSKCDEQKVKDGILY